MPFEDQMLISSSVILSFLSVVLWLLCRRNVLILQNFTRVLWGNEALCLQLILKVQKC